MLGLRGGKENKAADQTKKTVREDKPTKRKSFKKGKTKGEKRPSSKLNEDRSEKHSILKTVLYLGPLKHRFGIMSPPKPSSLANSMDHWIP